MHTDLMTWLLDVGYDRIFRMLEYRRPGDWTPYEQEKKYLDESHYVDNHYTFIKIKEVIELPDGDVLIGYYEAISLEDLEEKEHWIHYKKLSQIELSWNPDDEREENWD